VATSIYGASDDLIEFDGDVRGEVGCYGTDDKEQGVLISCSDGTILEVKYGKGGAAIWGIMVIQKGRLLTEVKACVDEDAKIYSDVAVFATGLKWAYASQEWERVK